MKNITTLLYCMAIFSLLLFCTSCEDEKPDVVKPDVPKEDGAQAWLVDYMEARYLWNNDRIDELDVDDNGDYQKVLSSILLGIAGQNNVNKEDGVWEGGVRQYFFSNISRESLNTRADVKNTQTGFGIYNMIYGYLDEARTKAYFIVLGVTPGSPADDEGLKRGDIIVKVDGLDISVDIDELNDIWRSLKYPQKSVSVTTASLNSDGILGAPRVVELNITTYEDNPIWKSKIIVADDGTKVGYLNYSHFDYMYDDKLIEIFSDFKAQGVEELILDFRYNGGGHVVSSVVIGSAIAGVKHKGEVFGKLIFNDERVANNEVDYYRIGDRSNYPLIEDAMSSGFANLDRVFIFATNSSASASELVINGLRGVDIEVNLIGGTTVGKNTGMESITKNLDGYKYHFSPITFYTENAKGFKDYHAGFMPDVEVAENNYKIYDFGSKDEKFISLALKWIETGTRPVIDTRASSDRYIGTFDAPVSRLRGSVVLEDYIVK